MSELEEEWNNTRYYPTNGFDEMIRMTEKGQLWQYPINNEQGVYTLMNGQQDSKRRKP